MQKKFEKIGHYQEKTKDAVNPSRGQAVEVLALT
jgi:hypothetical protein